MRQGRSPRCWLSLPALALIAAALAGATASAGRTRSVSIVDLGIEPGFERSFANDINHQGDSVGSSYTVDAEGDTTAAAPVSWRGTHLTALLVPEGATYGWAFGKNERGQVVGWSAGEDGIRHAVVWKHGRVHYLPAPGDALGSVAWVNNNRGQIVGVVSTGEETDDTVLWDHGRYFNLNALLPPGSGWSNLNPFVLNDRGELVGQGIHDDQFRAFRLTIR